MARNVHHRQSGARRRQSVSRELTSAPRIHPSWTRITMQHVFEIRKFAGAISVSILVGILGCASVPLRTETSTSDIRAAEESGAAKVPQAALHLQLAKEQLAKARDLAANGEKAQADSMLARAESDAELAVALSHEDTEKAEARAAVARVRQLRRENR